MPTWESVLASYKSELEEEGLALATVRAYLTDASQLIAELDKVQAAPLEADEKALQEAFWANLDGPNGSGGTLRFSANTIRRKASSFNRFTDFMLREGLLERLGSLRTAALAGSSWDWQWTLSEQRLAEILLAPDAGTALGARDVAMLGLLAFCGLRSGEISRLDLDDLSLDEELISVRRSTLAREVWVPPYVDRRLHHWLAFRCMFAKSTEALFVTIGKGGKPMPGAGRLGPRGVRKAAAKYLRSIGHTGEAPTLNEFRKAASHKWIEMQAAEAEVTAQYSISPRTLRAYQAFVDAL